MSNFIELHPQDKSGEYCRELVNIDLVFSFCDYGKQASFLIRADKGKFTDVLVSETYDEVLQKIFGTALKN